MTARPIVAYSICKNLKKERKKIVKLNQVGNGNETARPIRANGISKNLNCTKPHCVRGVILNYRLPSIV